MRNLLLSSIALAAVALLLPAHAYGKGKGFAKVPGSKGKDLQMRTVEYSGSTNGRMVIEVRNDGKTAQRFEAAGLYFVPGGEPEQAPQRLGAAGPFEVVGADGTTGDARQAIDVEPGAAVKLELHVFCIDSHRASPSSSTPFTVAAKRMPKQLRAKIQTGATKILERHKGKVAPAAASEIQSHVWESRNADWVELEGERANEKTSDGPAQRRERHPHRRPQRQK